MVSEDMKDLTKEEISPIYEKNYWVKAKCYQLPYGLDIVVLD